MVSCVTVTVLGLAELSVGGLVGLLVEVEVEAWWPVACGLSADSVAQALGVGSEKAAAATAVEASVCWGDFMPDGPCIRGNSDRGSNRADLETKRRLPWQARRCDLCQQKPQPSLNCQTLLLLVTPQAAFFECVKLLLLPLPCLYRPVGSGLGLQFGDAAGTSGNSRSLMKSFAASHLTTGSDKAEARAMPFPFPFPFLSPERYDEGSTDLSNGQPL